MRACVLSHFTQFQLFATLWTVAHQVPLSMDSPGKNTGVGCHALLQGIFLIQRLNLCLLHLLYCRQFLYPLNHLKVLLSQITKLILCDMLKNEITPFLQKDFFLLLDILKITSSFHLPIHLSIHLSIYSSLSRHLLNAALAPDIGLSPELHNWIILFSALTELTIKKNFWTRKVLLATPYFPAATERKGKYWLSGISLTKEIFTLCFSLKGEKRA